MFLFADWWRCRAIITEQIRKWGKRAKSSGKIYIVKYFVDSWIVPQTRGSPYKYYWVIHPPISPHYNIFVPITTSAKVGTLTHNGKHNKRLNTEGHLLLILVNILYFHTSSIHLVTWEKFHHQNKWHHQSRSVTSPVWKKTKRFRVGSSYNWT